MGIIRFIFAPLFWLRDIRIYLKDIATLLRWNWVLSLRFSHISAKRKRDLVVAMLRLKSGKKSEDAASYETEAAALLNFLEMDDK